MHLVKVIDAQLPAAHRHTKDHGALHVGRAFGSRRHEESGLAHDAEGLGANLRKGESLFWLEPRENLVLKHFGNPQAQTSEEGRRCDGDVDAPRAIRRRHRGDTTPHPRAKV